MPGSNYLPLYMFAVRPTWVTRLDELHLLTLARIALYVVVAMVASILVRRFVERALRGLGLGRPGTAWATRRHETINTVARSTLVALIWLVALITIVGELGVNIGAFVAGATIIGGALAFGAQTLVRDLIAGFFLLAEDQFGVGDVVDLGQATGVVEQITLRITRLRDNEGRVWYVPNGQIQRVANLSNEYARAVLDVPIPFDSDVAAVSRELEAIGREVRADHSQVIDDPEVLGIHSVEDDRIVLRLMAKTEPAGQFAVRRELRAALVTAMQGGRLPRMAAVGPAPTVVIVRSEDDDVAHDS